MYITNTQENSEWKLSYNLAILQNFEPLNSSTMAQVSIVLEFLELHIYVKFDCGSKRSKLVVAVEFTT